MPNVHTSPFVLYLLHNNTSGDIHFMAIFNPEKKIIRNQLKIYTCNSRVGVFWKKKSLNEILNVIQYWHMYGKFLFLEYLNVAHLFWNWNLGHLVLSPFQSLQSSPHCVLQLGCCEHQDSGAQNVPSLRMPCLLQSVR